MKSDWHPEIAAPAQKQAKEQSPCASIKDTQPIFARATEVAVSEYC
jgi:hypothetical protein